MNKVKLFSSAAARDLSLAKLLGIFADKGVNSIVYKNLSPNDNSKNQPYLAGHFTDLGFIPTGELKPTVTASRKAGAEKRKVKFTSSLDWAWIDQNGVSHEAPNTKLIYYPQYPEVRLSDFLQGSRADLDGWMDPLRRGRAQGRVLVLGLTNTRIYAWLAVPETRIAKEIQDAAYTELSSVLRELVDPNKYSGELDAKALLLQELARIYRKGPIESKRLNGEGRLIPYRAQNGGGFTLEAELGVIPNGVAEPDFLGWEVKQFSVNKGKNPALTLMTPEPDGGFYKTKPLLEFMLKYGYTNKDDRYDFNGIHKCHVRQKKTNLLLQLTGFDRDAGKLSDATGGIYLIDEKDEVAASWSYAKIIGHWKQKHARAVYVPSTPGISESAIKSYQYGPEIRLFEGTHINLLLKQFDAGAVYYDPGINIKNISTRPRSKKRNQIRVKSNDLHNLYTQLERVDLSDY